jgi:hypothetical protein
VTRLIKVGSGYGVGSVNFGNESADTRKSPESGTLNYRTLNVIVTEIIKNTYKTKFIVLTA